MRCISLSCDRVWIKYFNSDAHCLRAINVSFVTNLCGHTKTLFWLKTITIRSGTIYLDTARFPVGIGRCSIDITFYGRREFFINFYRVIRPAFRFKKTKKKTTQNLAFRDSSDQQDGGDTVWNRSKRVLIVGVQYNKIMRVGLLPEQKLRKNKKTNINLFPGTTDGFFSFLLKTRRL